MCFTLNQTLKLIFELLQQPVFGRNWKKLQWVQQAKKSIHVIDLETIKVFQSIQTNKRMHSSNFWQFSPISKEMHDSRSESYRWVIWAWKPTWAWSFSTKDFLWMYKKNKEKLRLYKGCKLKISFFRFKIQPILSPQNTVIKSFELDFLRTWR